MAIKKRSKKFNSGRRRSVKLVPPGDYDVECSMYKQHVYQGSVLPGMNQARICGVCGSHAKFHPRGWMDTHGRGDPVMESLYENPKSQSISFMMEPCSSCGPRWKVENTPGEWPVLYYTDDYLIKDVTKPYKMYSGSTKKTTNHPARGAELYDTHTDVLIGTYSTVKEAKAAAEQLMRNKMNEAYENPKSQSVTFMMEPACESCSSSYESNPLSTNAKCAIGAVAVLAAGGLAYYFYTKSSATNSAWNLTAGQRYTITQSCTAAALTPVVLATIQALESMPSTTASLIATQQAAADASAPGVFKVVAVTPLTGTTVISSSTTLDCLKSVDYSSTQSLPGTTNPPGCALTIVNNGASPTS